MYLGVKLSEDGKMKNEVERRIGMAMQTVGAMKSCMRAKILAGERK